MPENYRTPYGSRQGARNMRYPPAGESCNMSHKPPPAQSPPKAAAANTPAPMGIKLDSEMLLLIAVAVILSKNGADWPLLAALIYIMM